MAAATGFSAASLQPQLLSRRPELPRQKSADSASQLEQFATLSAGPWSHSDNSKEGIEPTKLPELTEIGFVSMLNS
jgi:hypothetical protein